MADVKINIGGREFEVACREGEEHFLHSAAGMLDNEAGALNEALGRMPETRMLLIRYDEDPKTALMFEDWSRDHPRAMLESDYIGPLSYRKAVAGQEELSEVQAEAILNMRLRSLRRLEEMELRRERDALQQERATLVLRTNNAL